jgi:predicted amidohydrolase YtcJ
LGGVIEVDDLGEPTGIIKERAVELILAALQKNSNSGNNLGEKLSQQMRMIKEGMTMCTQFGLTTVQTNDDGALLAYRELQQKLEIPLRIFLTPVHEELNRDGDEKHKGIKGIAPFRPACFKTNPKPQSEKSTDSPLSILDASAADSMLLMERVKIFSDGSLGAETAALRNLTNPQNDSKSGSHLTSLFQPVL